MSKKASKYIEKLHKICNASVHKKDINCAFSAVDACSRIHYYENQVYTDDILEDTTNWIEKQIDGPNLKKCEISNNTVLFYDGFGNDVRGLLLNYISGLVSNNYDVIYCTTSRSIGKQPVLDEMIANSNIKRVYFDADDSHIMKTKHIITLIEELKPARILIYTLPEDVSGVVAISHFRNIIERYQIDLTDHNFWLGRSMFDYCIEFREYGAEIAYKYRKINRNSIMLLPFYPFVPRSDFQGLPFDYYKRRFVFSGGHLYKTRGDNNMTYYQIVERILEENPDVVFYYAGEGEPIEFKRLKLKWKDRLFYTGERTDFYEVIKRCSVYLNTYPLLGGLMTQYAASAGVVPLTLVDDDNYDASQGFLINEREVRTQFRKVDDLLAECNKLLKNENYRANMGKEIRKHILEATEFEDQLNTVLTSHISPNKITYKDIDTTRFQMNASRRQKKKGAFNVEYAIARKRNKELLIFFPYIFLKRAIRRSFSIIVRENENSFKN